MIRRDMSPYIAERLLFFKKNYEGICQIEDLFPRREDNNKVQIGDFEFRFNYRFHQKENEAFLDIMVSSLTTDANKKLEDKFINKNFTKRLSYDNLILHEITSKKENSCIFKTSLRSIHDKRTYESVFEYIVKPLILGK